MAASQREIADIVGISPTTVSFVLNGRDQEMKVSPETARRVREAAERHGYRTNYHARTLTSGQSFTLGMALAGQDILGGRFWGPVAAGISDAALQEGYDLLLVVSGRGESALQRGLRFLEEKRLDALIVTGAIPASTDGKTGRPLVAIRIGHGASAYPTVDLDPAPGIEDAVTHLADLGHRDVLWLGRQSESGEPLLPERLAAFRRAARQAGIAGREQFVRAEVPASSPVTEYVAIYRRELAAQLRLDPRTTAIVCFNDTMGLALYSVLAERGLRIPADLSVVGFDDMHASYAVPAMTTISHMLHEMGVKAVELALARIGGKPVSGEGRPVLARIPARLVVRESTTVARTTHQEETRDMTK